MAQTSGFFNSHLDSQGNFDRVYLAEQFASYFSNFIGNGVFAHLLDKFVVTAGSGLSINVGTGKAFCKGYWFESDAQESLSIDLPDGLLNRKDNVVIRYDFKNREASIQVIKGTAATTPSAPEVVRNSLVFDLKIAEIFVGASISAISQSAITDTRLDNSVCGLVTGVVDQIDTTSLFTQFQTAFQEWKGNQQADYEDWTDAQKAAFNAWFQNVKDQLSTDAAGHLQEQINEHEALFNSLSQTQTQQASALTELDGRVDSLDDQVAANVQSINGLNAMLSPLIREQNCINNGANGIQWDLDKLMTLVRAGKMDEFAIGDYFVDGGVTWRIFAKNYYPRMAFDGSTAGGNVPPNHIVCLPDTSLGSYQFNKTDTNSGGYAGSLMPANMVTEYNKLSTKLKSYVKETRIYENNKSSWVVLKRYMRLPSVVEMTGNLGWADQYSVGVCSQFPLAKATKHRIKDYWYWLLDPAASNATSFCRIAISGNSSSTGASSPGAVRPEIVLA